MLEESVLNYHIVLQWKINKIAFLNVLEELRDKHLFLNRQCSTEISFLPPLLLPSVLFHRWTDQWGITVNWLWSCSLIFQKWTVPSFSRCTCYEWQRRHVAFIDFSLLEKEYFPVSMSIQFRLLMGINLNEESTDSLFFVVSLLPWSCTQNLLLSFYRIFFELMLCKLTTNLFDPWKILTQLLIRPQFWCSFGSLHEIVRDLQCLLTWKNVQLRNPVPTQNLLNCLVVTAFQFVIHIVAIENLICWVTTIWRNVFFFFFDNTGHEWGTWLSHHNGSLVNDANVLPETQTRRDPRLNIQDWRARVRNGWYGASLRPGEETDTRVRFLWETSANLTNKHNQLGTLTVTHQHWINTLLAASSGRQSCSINLCTPSVRFPVCAEETREWWLQQRQIDWNNLINTISLNWWQLWDGRQSKQRNQ